MSIAKEIFNTPCVNYNMLELLVMNQCHHLVSLYKACQEQLFFFVCFFSWSVILFLETIQKEHRITQG